MPQAFQLVDREITDIVPLTSADRQASWEITVRVS
jgi:hypothetical protein